jgi:hypothetical protein
MIVKIHQTKTIKLNIISKLIMLLQGTSYSHYSIELIDEILIHATRKGVHYSSKKEFLIKNKIVNTYNILVDANSHHLTDWAAIYINKRYGFFQIFGILLMSLRIIKANPFGRGDKFIICSELVVYFLIRFKQMKISKADNYDLNMVDQLLKDRGMR